MRDYLVCAPRFFDVRYRINPWMNPAAGADAARAMRQWDELIGVYRRLGHTIIEVDPIPNQPDMVFAANAGLVSGDSVLMSHFTFSERQGEERGFEDVFRTLGLNIVSTGDLPFEGEGDAVTMPDRILYGHGFRSHPDVAPQIAALTGLEVVPLGLVDPRFYHLDTAMFRIADTLAWFPPAFDPESRAAVRDMYPDALEIAEPDALAFGLNSVCDGETVIVPSGASGVARELAGRGFVVRTVDMTELMRAGGAAKCCTLELHGVDLSVEFGGVA